MAADPVHDEAAHWLVALDEAPDDGTLRARFAEWLAADPAHAAAWQDTSQVYELLGQLPAVDGGRWKAPTAARGGLVRGRRWAIAAVAALVAAAIAMTAAPALRIWSQADIVTSTGEQRDIALPDGSLVRLGPGSAMASRYEGGLRQVRLLKGLAFFTVARDPARPFQVSAGRLQATAVGTAFEVRLTDRASVAVAEGIVEARSLAGEAPWVERLEPGDRVTVAGNGLAVRGRGRPDEVAAWRHGRIVARDLPLEAVVDEIRGYYRGAIVLTDAGLGRQRVSGVYNAADPLGAVLALVAPHGGVVRRFSPWLIVISGS